MEPAFTWLDFTARDREKMRRVLDLFGEQGTVDELGLGTIRDALADALFPGTSSIQTRLRYMLFIPWIYMDLEKRRVASEDVAYQARKGELSLIEPLKNSDDNFGVIGAVAGHSLARLPSHVYWSGLVRWRIFLQPKTQSWYHIHEPVAVAGWRRPDGRSGHRGDQPAHLAPALAQAARRLP